MTMEQLMELPERSIVSLVAVLPVLRDMDERGFLLDPDLIAHLEQIRDSDNDKEIQVRQ